MAWKLSQSSTVKRGIRVKTEAGLVKCYTTVELPLLSCYFLVNMQENTKMK